MSTTTQNGSDLSSRSTEFITATLVSEENSSSSDSDSTDSDEELEQEQDQQRLRALFLKAKASAKAADLAKLSIDPLKNNDQVVLFDEEEDEASDNDQTITPSSSKSTTKSSLPASLVRPLHLRAPSSTNPSTKTNAKGKGKETTGITLAQDLGGAIESLDGGKGGEDRWGRAPKPYLSKKQRQALHAPTAGPKWFNMPAQVMTPELKREVQAMRLRNALDPKRFYKGGAKDSKTMPEFFQLGHILPSTSSASNAVTAIPRKRTFVEELVDDEQAKAYTKRKFQSEVMVRGMSGRGRSKKGGRAKGRGGKGRA